jgi:uncharacterized damage-inducible protein DinB
MQEKKPEKETGLVAAPSQRRQLILEPLLAGSEATGLWSAALTDCRARTMKAIAGIGQNELDWRPPVCANTIGTLLYHIALIEVDWLYAEILERPIPEDLKAMLRLDDRQSNGELTSVQGETASQHEHRLARVRQALLQALGGMTLTEFRRIRHLPDYDVTPEWVVLHLMQHEAEHRGQIVVIRKSFEQIDRSAT